MSKKKETEEKQQIEASQSLPGQEQWASKTKILIIGDKRFRERSLQEYATAGYLNVDFLETTDNLRKNTESLIDWVKAQHGNVIIAEAYTNVLPQELHDNLLLSLEEADAVGVMLKGRPNTLNFSAKTINGKTIHLARYILVGTSPFLALKAEKYHEAKVIDNYIMDKFAQITAVKDTISMYLLYSEELRMPENEKSGCKTCG